MKISRFDAIFFLTLIIPSSVALADGIDIVPYMTRVGYHSWAVSALLILVLFGINFVLNGLFVLVPATAGVGLPWREKSYGLLLLTTLGQLADRVGAFMALFVAVPIANILGSHIPYFSGEAGPFLVLIVSNFILSGIAIGLLAFWVARRYWKVSSRRAWIASLCGAILTNPAWALHLGPSLF